METWLEKDTHCGGKGYEMKMIREKMTDMGGRQLEEARLRCYSFSHASIWDLFSNC